MAMTVSVNFNPAVPGGQVTVTGETFTEVKNKVATELGNRLATQQNNVTALQNALNNVNS